MTYKQFKQWCNERASDGCWGFREATSCIEILSNLKKLPFWKRKKMWDVIGDEVVRVIVEPTNRKIQEIRGANDVQ
jgi:hypothetical protein